MNTFDVANDVMNGTFDLTDYFDFDIPFIDIDMSGIKTWGPILMMTLPAVVSILRDAMPTLQYEATKIVKKTLGLNPYEVEIRYQKQEREGLYEIVSEECHQNKLLQSMIKMYVNTLKPYKQWHDSETNLMAEREESNDHPFADDWEDDLMYGATSKALDCYSVVSIPEEGDWVEIEKNLYFTHDTNEMEDDKKDNNEKQKQTQVKLSDRAEVTVTLVTIRLQSTRGNPQQHIDEFLEKVMNWYKNRLNASISRAKYMYQIYQPESKKKPKTAVDLEDEEEEKRVYKRYKLESKKCFDTLFIPSKPDLLRLVDNFLNKRDVFSKPGFPDKLGLLLYGPPGTGKTTLIKCLAKYTNRNIININLARVKTNQELMDIMYEMNFNVEHLDDPVRMEFKDVIFVMEDIDCAGNVVKSRDDRTGMMSEATHHDGTTPWDVTLTKTMTQPDIEEHDHDTLSCDTKKKTNNNDNPLTKLFKNGRKKLLGKKTKGFTGDEHRLVKEQVMEIINKTVTGDIGEMVDWALDQGDEDESECTSERDAEETEEVEAEDEEEEEDDDDEQKPPAAPIDDGSDKLNLAGLLNALDGVIDTPGRIVIMTTNVQQSLDTALIRPGRVNLRIELGFMCAKEASEMFNYYFDADDTLSLPEMRTIWTDNRFTPAEMEQMCAEHDTLDSLFAHMKTVLRDFPTRVSMKRQHTTAAA